MSFFGPLKLMPATKNAAGGWYKATIGRRFLAVFIDGLIIGVVSVILTLFIFNSPSTKGYSSLVQTVLAWVYAVFFISQMGATPGKMAMGVKVVKTNGAKLSIWDAVLREVIGKFISGLVLMLGYLWAFWDPNRQTWHDKIAGTYAVTKIPNNGKSSGCLIALAVAVVAGIPAIAILAAVVVLMINPLELTRQSRDAKRITDITIINQALITAKSDDVNLNLCQGMSAPCMSKSTDSNASNKDGSGWVKVDLSSSRDVQEASLPLDPVNDATEYYQYCSDGKDWEIDFKLESKKNEAMKQDQGDRDDLYEIGSNRTLCK